MLIMGRDRYSRLTPTPQSGRSLGVFPILPLTPTRAGHSYSYSHAPIAELGAGVEWCSGRKERR
jgi:hypothetical protein